MSTGEDAAWEYSRDEAEERFWAASRARAQREYDTTGVYEDPQHPELYDFDEDEDMQ